MKSSRKISACKLLCSVLVSAVLLALPTAQAATNTWNGAGVGANTGLLWDVAGSYNPSATFSTANDIDLSTITNPGASLTLSAGSAGSIDVNNLNFGTAVSGLVGTERINFNGNGTPGATTLNLTGGIALPKYTGSIVTLGSDLTLNLSNTVHTVSAPTGTSVLVVNALVTGGGAAAAFNNASTAAPMIMTNNNNSFTNGGLLGTRYNGYLGFTSVGNVGSGNSSLGNATTAANGLLWMSNGATLDFIGVGNQSTDRAIQLDGTVVFANSAAGTTLTYNGVNNYTGGAGSEVRGAVTSGSTVIFNSVIGGVFGVRTQSNIGYTTAGSTTINNGQGTLVLNGNNTFTGGVTINNGTLQIGNVNALGTTGGTTTVGAGATLDLNGITSVAEPIAGISGTGNGGIGALVNSNTSTPASLTGTVVMTGSTSIGGAGDYTLSGVISASAARTLTKIGAGNITFAGTNTYTGTIAVNQGTVTLGFGTAGAPATNILTTSGAGVILAMGGGTLNLTGAASTTNSQTFASTTFNAGASTLTINNSATANPESVTLAAGSSAITRNVGSTVTFNQPTNGTVGANNGYVMTGTGAGTGTASTILTDAAGVAYATVGANDWAAKDATNAFIVGGSTLGGFYTANTATTLSGNADMSAGNTALAAASTPTSLRFNTAAANTTITATGQTLTTGGILIGSTVGANNTFITGGTLKGGNTKDLTVIQNSTGTLTISSVIANNTSTTGLTKSGTGALTLSGVNTYAGTTTVNGGTLTVSGSGNFGSVNSSMTVNTGGTVDLNGTTQGVGGLTGTGGTILNNATGTNVTFTVGNSTGGGTYTGVITDHASGTGTVALTKVSTGTEILTGANTYTGATTINGGTLQSANSGALSTTTAVAVNNAGSTLGVNYGGGLDYTQAQVGTLLAKTTFGATTTAFAFDTTNVSSGAIYSNALTMAAGLTKLGLNTLILTGANTYTGATTISGSGTLQSANNGALSTTSGITINGASSTLAVNYGGSFDYTQAQVATLLAKTTFGATNTAFAFDTTNGSATYGNALTMAAGLTKLGANTLTLTGTNTYTGATTVSVGTLQLGNGGTTGSLATTSAITLSTNTNLTINRSNAVTQGTDFSAAALAGSTVSFTQAGTGTTTLNAANTYGGTTTVSAGTLIISGSQTGTGATIINGGTLAISGSPTGNASTMTTALSAGKLKLDYSTNNTSKLADLAVLTLTGGTVELSGGSHTEVVLSTTLQTGTTFIKQTSGTSKLALGAITFSSGAMDFGAANIATTTSTNNVSGILGSAVGSGRLTVAGTDFAANDGSGNIVAYTGYTTYAGSTSGNTNYSLAGSYTNGAATASTSTLKITTTTTGQSLAVQANTFSNGTILFAGANDYAITTTTGSIATNNLLNYGTGTLSLGALGAVSLIQNGTGKTILTTNATGDNALTVNGGTVQFSNNLQIGTNATAKVITLNNGTIVANTAGGSIALDNAGTLSRTVTIGAGGGTIDVIGGNTLTVSGVISGTSSLNFGSATSNGTITLTGANTYSGAINVAGGKLTIGSAGTINATSGVSIGAGEFNYNSSTPLAQSVTFSGTGGTLSGGGTITPNVTVTAGNTLAPGNSIGTLTFGGNLTLAGTSNFQLGNSTGAGTHVSPYNSDRSVVAGVLTLGGTLNLLDNATANGNGSVAPGAYLLFTQSGTPTGSFTTVNNVTGYHSVVNTATSGSVFLDNYALAAAATTQTVNVGAYHVGVGATTAVTLANSAPTNATYTETLQTNGFSSTTSNFTTAGSASGIAGGGTGSGSLLVGVGTGLGAGPQSGSTVLALQSNAVNGSGLGTTSVGNQTITINATGYNLAAADASQTVNLATRVGTGVTTTISVANTAPVNATYTETLGTTGFTGTTSNFTATGSAATGIAGGSSGGSFTVGILSGGVATSGVHSGSTTLGLQTEAVNSSGLGTLGITGQTVNINVTAYDLASPTISKAAGDGTLGGAGTSYTLDFGTGLTVGQTYTANLRLNNADLGSGYQDGIKAGYTYTMTNGATITVNSISQLALAAGQYSDFSISFLGASAGSYGDTLTLGALFSQQSGLSDYGLSNIDITITAAAIPEPSTYAAIFGALALAGAALRRRRRN